MRYLYDIHHGLTKIKTKLFYSVAGLGLVMGSGGMALAAFGTAHAAATCTDVNTSKGTLSAAQIGGSVRGALDATGCDIGVYYNHDNTGKVSQANIYGSTQYGVFVDGNKGDVKVNVSQSSIHQIGDNPFDGAQHGVGIYYYGIDTNGKVTGKVSQNHVYDYQKGGIVINGQKADANVSQNTVTGQGPVDYIAQNGIQFGYGSTGTVTQNTVTGNSYTGSSTTSAGILVVGGDYYGSAPTKNIKIAYNTVRNNDVGIDVQNPKADYTGPNKPTDLNITHNIISSNAVTNGIPYQAGIADIGNSDKITYNSISGTGYDPSNPALLPIDASAPYAKNVTLSHNTYDSQSYP